MDTKDNDEEISRSAHDRVRSFRSSFVVPPNRRCHDSPMRMTVRCGWTEKPAISLVEKEKEARGWTNGSPIDPMRTMACSCGLLWVPGDGTAWAVPQYH